MLCALPRSLCALACRLGLYRRCRRHRRRVCCRCRGGGAQVPQRGGLLVRWQARHYRLQQLHNRGELGVVPPWHRPNGHGRWRQDSVLRGRGHRRRWRRGGIGGGQGTGEGGQQGLRTAAARTFLRLQSEQLFQQRDGLMVAHGRRRRRGGWRSGLPWRGPPCEWPRGDVQGWARERHACRERCRARRRTPLRLLRPLCLLH